MYSCADFPIHSRWIAHKLSVRTHSSPEMRFPSRTFLQTSDTPPVLCTPTTMTASCPANITTVWKTSVQMTAFRPPCQDQTRHTRRLIWYMSVSVNSHRDELILWKWCMQEIQKWTFRCKGKLQCLTIVVYNVHTSPVASTAPHSSNPVTARKHRNKSNLVCSKRPSQRKIKELYIPAFSAKAGVYTQTPI